MLAVAPPCGERGLKYNGVNSATIGCLSLPLAGSVD